MPGSETIRWSAGTPAAGKECDGFARARDAAMKEIAAGLRDATGHVDSSGAKHAVAIPVRNEMHRIAACLDALAAQRDLRGKPFPAGHFRVVLLFNNSTDDGYALVKRQLARWPIAIAAYDVALPGNRRHAGHARRLANHAALRDLPPDGVLFTTDADSRVPPDWIARYTALIADGWDAVAGLAELSPDDHGDIPPSLARRSALEDRYASLLDELESLIDPVPHDPWQRHYGASGANMAVRAGTMRTLDDFPRVPCGEDRQLAAMLERADHRVRHDTQTRVLTSGRLFGRAAGGKADTLRHRVLVPEAACDERLECAETAFRRATLRAMLRALRQQAKPAAPAIDALAAEAGVAPATLWPLCVEPSFGAAWSRLESLAPGLHRSAITPSRLPAEIRRCEALVETLRHARDPAAGERQELTA